MALGDRRRAARRSEREQLGELGAERVVVPRGRGTRPRARSSAGTSVSGTNRPPNSPKRPRPTGSGPGGSRCTGVATDGSGHRVIAWRRSGGEGGARVAGAEPTRVDGGRERSASVAVGHPVVGRGLGVGVGHPVAFLELVAAASRAARRSARSLRGVLVARARRGLDPGRHVDAPRPHPPDRRRPRCRRAARRRAAGARPAGTASASAQSNAMPEPGLVGVDQDDVDRAVGDRRQRGVAGARTPGSRTAPAGGSSARRRAARGPWSCAPPRPSVFTISTTRSWRSSRNTPDGDDAGREAVEDLADGVGRDLAGAAAARRRTRARRHPARRRGARPPRW